MVVIAPGGAANRELTGPLIQRCWEEAWLDIQADARVSEVCA